MNEILEKLLVFEGDDVTNHEDPDLLPEIVVYLNAYRKETLTIAGINELRILMKERISLCSLNCRQKQYFIENICRNKISDNKLYELMIIMSRYEHSIEDLINLTMLVIAACKHKNVNNIKNPKVLRKLLAFIYRIKHTNPKCPDSFHRIKVMKVDAKACLTELLPIVTKICCIDSFDLICRIVLYSTLGFSLDGPYAEINDRLLKNKVVV